MASKKKQLKNKNSPVENKTEATGAKAQTQMQPEAGTLAIGDLKNIATIIDVASTRGAFRANEMATVGAMFNKLQAFLAKVAPEPKPEDAPAAPVTAEAKK